MKKIINCPENYTDDMLRGIYAAYPEKVTYANGNLRCCCTTKKTPGKVSIVTGGGTGHLPLFLGYVGEGLLDGCAVGSVFQSPSAEWIYDVCKEVDNGAGILFLYGNYTGDIMNFDMAAELCEMDGIQTRSIVGADDVCSASAENSGLRRGVAGILFMYKCAGAKAAQMAALDEVLAVAQKVRENVRTVGFAMSPCTIPEVGHPNFTLEEGTMSMGMGIHGEPGIWNGPMKTARELAAYALDTILADISIQAGERVAVLLNGLGATSIEEFYILNAELHEALQCHGIHVAKTYVGEFATSMEMAGASVSVCKLDDGLLALLNAPASTPFFCPF